MTTEQKKAIADAGGKAVHEKGKADKFTTATAKEAGRKGGKAVSQIRSTCQQLGRRVVRHAAETRVQLVLAI